MILVLYIGTTPKCTVRHFKPSEDLDQPMHLYSFVLVFANCSTDCQWHKIHIQAVCWTDMLLIWTHDWSFTFLSRHIQLLKTAYHTQNRVRLFGWVSCFKQQHIPKMINNDNNNKKKYDYPFSCGSQWSRETRGSNISRRAHFPWSTIISWRALKRKQSNLKVKFLNDAF